MFLTVQVGTVLCVKKLGLELLLLLPINKGQCGYFDLKFKKPS